MANLEERQDNSDHDVLIGSRWKTHRFVSVNDGCRVDVEQEGVTELNSQITAKADLLSGTFGRRTILNGALLEGIFAVPSSPRVNAPTQSALHTAQNVNQQTSAVSLRPIQSLTFCRPSPLAGNRLEVCKRIMVHMKRALHVKYMDGRRKMSRGVVEEKSNGRK